MKAWILDEPGRPLALREVTQPQPRRGAGIRRHRAWLDDDRAARALADHDLRLAHRLSPIPHPRPDRPSHRPEFLSLTRKVKIVLERDRVGDTQDDRHVRLRECNVAEREACVT